MVGIVCFFGASVFCSCSSSSLSLAQADRGSTAMPTRTKPKRKRHVGGKPAGTMPLGVNGTSPAAPSPPPIPPVASTGAKEDEEVVGLTARSSTVQEAAGRLPPSVLASCLVDLVPVPPLFPVASAAALQPSHFLYSGIPPTAAPLPPMYLPPPVAPYYHTNELEENVEDGKDKNAFEEEALAAPKARHFNQWSKQNLYALLSQGTFGWACDALGLWCAEGGSRPLMLIFSLSSRQTNDSKFHKHLGAQERASE